MQNLLQILGDILSVVRTGLETIVLLIQALLSNTGRGVDQIKAMAPDVARQYLRALGITAIIAVALPVVLGGVSIFFGLKGTTAFIGLLCLAVCFVFGLVMTPIGVLINAALPPYGGAGQEKGLFWRAVQGIGRNAQEGVQKYFRSVRIVLGWEALFFFFAAILPVENYRGAVFILLLGTVGLGLINPFTNRWAYLARGAVFLGIVYTLLAMIFPKISVIAFLFPAETTAELTNATVERQVATWWQWLNNSWNEPGTIILAVVFLGLLVGLFFFLAKGVRGAARNNGATSAGGGHAGGHEESASATGKNTLIWVAVAALIVLIVWMMQGFGNGIQRNTASYYMAVAEDAARQARAMAIPSPIQPRIITAPALAAGGRTNWSEQVERQGGSSTYLVADPIPGQLRPFVRKWTDGVETDLDTPRPGLRVRYRSTTNIPIQMIIREMSRHEWELESAHAHSASP